jgi:hypothetical protein
MKPDNAELISLDRVGGLHHRYTWKTAAWKVSEMGEERGSQQDDCA